MHYFFFELEREPERDDPEDDLWCLGKAVVFQGAGPGLRVVQCFHRSPGFQVTMILLVFFCDYQMKKI